MPVTAKRFAFLVIAGCAIAVSLIACAAPSGPASPTTTNSSSGFTFATPLPNLTPTPQFPGFTIGAWPSNYSPNNVDNITIYVLCRVQDPTMNTPSTPPQPLQVTVLVGDPINQPYTATTDSDGLAAVYIALNDTQSGRPVTVTVSANYKNQTYTGSTFFTPSPAAKPTPTAPAATTPAPGGIATPAN